NHKGVTGLHVGEQVAAALLIGTEPALVVDVPDRGKDRSEVDLAFAKNAPGTTGVVLQVDVVDDVGETTKGAGDVRFTGLDQVRRVDGQAEGPGRRDVEEAGDVVR